MTEKTPDADKGFSADWFLRGALTRIGDTFDRLTGRKWIPSSSLATSELINRIKSMLDKEARRVAGKGTVVPHNIRLKMQWDKFSTDSDDSLQNLERELLAAAADHINDSLYYTQAPLNVEVKSDYFTEGVKLFVSFDTESNDESEVELNVTIPSIAKPDVAADILAPREASADIYIARYEINGSRRDKRMEISPGSRHSVGRGTGNDLVIDDKSVSKIHAALVLNSDSSLSVADTGSTNGTFINGERIAYGKASRLIIGDCVKFGEIDVIFEHIPAEQETGQEINSETRAEEE